MCTKHFAGSGSLRLMCSPLLYCSDNASVLAIDVPTSIARAQGFPGQLHARTAPTEPFDVPEPRGQRRKQLQASVPNSQQEYDLSLRMVILDAYEVVRRELKHQRWCLPRAVLRSDLELISFAPRDMTVCQNKPTPPLILSQQPTVFDDSQDLTSVVVHNPYRHATAIDVASVGRFWIPARSTFLCSQIDHGVSAFDAATRIASLSRYRTAGQPIKFDLILLDPPWANRSVRRRRMYQTSEDQAIDPFTQTLPVLQTSLARTGHVAIWITNKPKLRRQVLDAFTQLQLTLCEEWSWLKVTDSGEPIVPLDGIWRKPYELLLLFSARPITTPLKRRSMIAVPDVHSRKPNLKFLFERVLTLPKRYDALEIFARSLTAGWWSWGNEVLAFQHEAHWSTTPIQIAASVPPAVSSFGG